MVDLDSLEWANLRHAYGPATDVPHLLRQLNPLSSSDGNAEPWFSIWSALAHQGDVYSASFAAVPHIVQVLSINPLEASPDYFQFPAWVEICRHRQKIAVPDTLALAYFEALGELPRLVGIATAREWDSGFLSVAMSAIAVGKGYPQVAEAALELHPDVATEFMKWFFAR
jgi:hypothetical protein